MSTRTTTNQDQDAPASGARVHPTSVHDEDTSEKALHEVDDTEFDYGDWEDPSYLPTIEPRPGFVQRWVRFDVNGQADRTNISRRVHQEGWRPRDPQTVQGGRATPTTDIAQFGRCISVKGMVLCEMPRKRNEQRKAYYDRRLHGQEHAVAQQLRDVEQLGHPITATQDTRVTVGRGRRPVVQGDDS